MEVRQRSTTPVAADRPAHGNARRRAAAQNAANSWLGRPPLEDEVTEFLGRERYARQNAVGNGAVYRNGYEPKDGQDDERSDELERPRIRNATELGFESQVLGKGVARTHALEGR